MKIKMFLLFLLVISSGSCLVIKGSATPPTPPTPPSSILSWVADIVRMIPGGTTIVGEKYGKEVQALLKQAEDNLAKNNIEGIEGAAKNYEDALNFQPKNFEVLQNLIITLAKMQSQEKSDEAIIKILLRTKLILEKFLTGLSKEDKNFELMRASLIRTLIAIARKYKEMGKIDEAIAEYKNALFSNLDLDVLTELIELFKNLVNQEKLFAKKVEILETLENIIIKAVSSLPKTDPIRQEARKKLVATIVDIAKLYKEAGKFGEAIKVIMDFLRGPVLSESGQTVSNAPLHLLRAEILEAWGKPEEAVSVLNLLLQANLKMEEAYHLMEKLFLNYEKLRNEIINGFTQIILMEEASTKMLGVAPSLWTKAYLIRLLLSLKEDAKNKDIVMKMREKAKELIKKMRDTDPEWGTSAPSQFVLQSEIAQSINQQLQPVSTSTSSSTSTTSGITEKDFSKEFDEGMALLKNKDVLSKQKIEALGKLKIKAFQVGKAYPEKRQEMREKMNQIVEKIAKIYLEDALSEKDLNQKKELFEKAIKTIMDFFSLGVSGHGEASSNLNLHLLLGEIFESFSKLLNTDYQFMRAISQYLFILTEGAKSKEAYSKIENFLKSAKKEDQNLIFKEFIEKILSLKEKLGEKSLLSRNLWTMAYFIRLLLIVGREPMAEQMIRQMQNIDQQWGNSEQSMFVLEAPAAQQISNKINQEATSSTTPVPQANFGFLSQFLNFIS